MAEGACDQYDFDNDDYVESQTPNLSDSFMEMFREDSSEDDFSGFTSEEAFIHGNRRMNKVHTAATDPAVQEADKENVSPAAKRPKKLTADPSSWKRNKRKIAYARGQATTDCRGRPLPSRKTGPPCGCRRECFSQVDVHERQRILETFNGMGDTSSQNIYLRGLIVGKDPKRLGSGGSLGINKPGKERKRAFSYEYFVQTSDLKRIPVCREAFISLHGITEQRAKTVRSKATPVDMRGRHQNRPHKITDDLKNQVRAHIQQYPRQMSHYSRAKNPNRKYLEEDQSVNRMYHKYIEKFEPEVYQRNKEILRSRQENRFPAPTPKKPKISLYTYRNIFNREFNLSFGVPRTDTCARCEALNMALLSCSGEEDEMNRLLEERREHQEKGENGYESKRRDKQRTQQSWNGKTRTLGDNSTSKDAIDMITFDFQQNLPTPHLHHNDIFYLRQLWTYNFGIHDCINERGYMFLWSETTAKRGSSEVASCLHKFFTEFKSGARSLVSYSDGCCGQNKNITIIGFYNEMHRNKVYERIDHKYLERGHTYLENDRDFAQIEKRKKTATVYLPEDWEEVVRESNVTNPFETTAMKQEDFLDWKGFVNERYKMATKDQEGKRVLLRDIHWLNFGWGEEKEAGKVTMRHHPDEVWVRFSLREDEPWKKLKIVRPRQTTTGQAIPRELYQGQVLLKAAKVKDLKKIASQFVPPLQRTFYFQLKDDGSEDGNSTDEDPVE